MTFEGFLFLILTLFVGGILWAIASAQQKREKVAAMSPEDQSNYPFWRNQRQPNMSALPNEGCGACQEGVQSCNLNG